MGVHQDRLWSKSNYRYYLPASRQGDTLHPSSINMEGVSISLGLPYSKCFIFTFFVVLEMFQVCIFYIQINVVVFV